MCILVHKCACHQGLKMETREAKAAVLCAVPPGAKACPSFLPWAVKDSTFLNSLGF